MSDRTTITAGACALAALWPLVLAAPPEAAAAEPADLVFRNGGVYTVDAARSWTEAVAVSEGRIAYVGTNAGAESHVGPATRIVDLAGRMLLPGFQDSHLHPGGGLDLGKVRLHGVFDREELFRRIAAWAEAHPERTWIEGRGWEAGAFKPRGVSRSSSPGARRCPGERCGPPASS